MLNEITSDIYSKLGFSDFSTDISRDVILDHAKSNLVVPFDQAKTKRLKSTSPLGFGICIKIATRTSNCSQGIGFRCGFISNCYDPKVQNLKASNILSRDRIQPVIITVNQSTGELIFHFENNIDWEYLRNN